MTKLTTRQADEKYNGSPMPMKAAWGEVKELGEAIVSLKTEDIVEEFHDAKYTLICAVAHITGWDLPIPFPKRNIEKMENRFSVWKEIFEKHNLKFDKKYLVNGANYLKVEKVEMALTMAKEEQRK